MYQGNRRLVLNSALRAVSVRAFNKGYDHGWKDATHAADAAKAFNKFFAE